MGKTKVKAEGGLHHFTHGPAIGTFWGGDEHDKIAIILQLVPITVFEGNEHG